MKSGDPATAGTNRSRTSILGGLVLTLLLDVGIVIGSYALALYLKFDGEVPSESWRQLAWAGPLIAFAYIVAYQILGVYKTAWQYGSVRDALLLAMAVAVVTGAILTVNVLLPKRPIPLTVNVISAAFIFLFHALARMGPRLFAASGVAGGPEIRRQKVLIVGAGDRGQFLAADLQNNRNRPYRAVAFVDDDDSLRGKRIHGVPVVGNRRDLPDAIEKNQVEVVAIALPERAQGLQEILTLIEPFKLPVRMVPGPSEMMDGRGALREITMEDLLAREPVEVDEAALRRAIAGKVVMLTGAVGFIGSELTRRIASMGPAAMHLLDTNETGLHEMRIELLQQWGKDLTLKPWLCSIVDRSKLQDIFEASRPQIVFHLAAYKHVPMMEEHPDQAFETNVIGTLNVLEAAQAAQTEQVIFLSSNVAVNPVSVYGASKRVGELMVASMSTPRTRTCAIRLTNIIDARGAVLSVFERQIANGGPVSVTDPQVARYFITVSEVAGLVLQAAALSQGGEIFLLDVGEEIRIGELAQRLIRARGLEPGKDIEIIYTGLRPGDKLRENLTSEYESIEPTSHPRVRKAVSSQGFSSAELQAGIRELEVDRRRRTGNLPARLHALARFDQAVVEDEQAQEARQPGQQQA